MFRKNRSESRVVKSNERHDSTKPIEAFLPRPGFWPRLKRFLPRVEFHLLLIGLGCTIFGKLTIVQRSTPHDVWPDLFFVIYPDLLFFAMVFLGIRCLYLLKPGKLTARCVLILATLISGWSIINTGWLIKSGVQLQPGVVKILIVDLWELLPLVIHHVTIRPGLAIALVLIIVGILIFFVRCLYHPASMKDNRYYHTRWVLGVLPVILALFAAQPKVTSDTSLGFTGEVLGFNSHWHALTSSFKKIYDGSIPAIQTRNIPVIGQRKIELPQTNSNHFPNIVLVLLESVSYSVTSMADPELNATPFLALLAREGVHFRLTRVPVSHTTKAFWATLTSTTPIIQANYVEAIPSPAGYEGLPSILARIGYRSAFFEMSRGSFECAPGFFSNLAFDWAWFRENLEDPSAHIGLLAGDDCRIIEPAMEWVQEQKGNPFFLMMITTVSHDPYQVPAHFGTPKELPYEKFVQSLQYTDYFLEQLDKTLKERNLKDNTILCIIGDHGTSFRGNADNGRWIPYEEVIRVPWIMRWPGHIEAGLKIDWPCSQLDYTPTILQLIGFDISRAGFEGRDAFTPSELNRRLYFSSWYTDSPIGFTEGNRKVVYWPYLDKIYEYHLDTDPNEENPRIISFDQRAEIIRNLREWENASQISIDARRFTADLFFSHWKTFSTGQSAWAFYVP